jgi:hypothetical protein
LPRWTKLWSFGQVAGDLPVAPTKLASVPEASELESPLNWPG